MTIQNTTTRKAGPSQGNGVNVSFPFTFKVFASADVLVTYLDAIGTESSLVLSTDYTVALNADQNIAPGGTVTLLWTPASSTYITLTSQVSYTQNLALTNAGGFYPTSINDALDRIVIQVQQLAELISRSAKAPLSGIGSLSPSSLVFGVDISGNPVLSKLTDITTSLLSTSMAAFLAGGQFISTLAGNLATGAGQIYLNGSGSNRIDFNMNGQGPPTFATRSAGTKLTLMPSIGASSADVAIGTDTFGMWFSTFSSSWPFKWYGGQTLAATLTGQGEFSTTSHISSGGNLSSTGDISAAGTISSTGNLSSAGSILSSSPTVGIGYSAGAGGSVTQANTPTLVKTNAITLNKICGTIVLNAGPMTAGQVIVIVFNNTTISAKDNIILSIMDAFTNGAYLLGTDQILDGGCSLTIKNIHTVALSEAVGIRFTLIKSVQA